MASAAAASASRAVHYGEHDGNDVVVWAASLVSPDVLAYARTGAQIVDSAELTLEADLGDQQVARVALALLGGERARDLDLVAAVLPQRDAAPHGRDVLVAEQLLHGVSGERRAVARGAVEDHAAGAVGHEALDPRLQVAARHVHGARQVRLLELVLLAYVDDHGAVAVMRQLLDVLGIDLLDLLLDVADEVCARSHYFRKDSSLWNETGAPLGAPRRKTQT
jgi:hypothetical protein